MAMGSTKKALDTFISLEALNDYGSGEQRFFNRINITTVDAFWTKKNANMLQNCSFFGFFLDSLAMSW